MNKTISLAAIAMFAVMMGLAAFAPAALAEKMPKVDLCHNDEGEDGIHGTEDDSWSKISVSGNAKQKHIDNHGDLEIGVDITEAECDALVNPPVAP